MHFRPSETIGKRSGESMKRSAWFLSVLICLVAFGYYNYISGKEFEIHLSEEQIREKLRARMPIRKGYLLIFEVILDNPRVALLDGNNRVSGGLDVVLNITIESEKLPLGGSLDVSGGVRYEPDKGQFFLTEPVIERLAVQGIPKLYVDKVNQVIAKELNDYYSNHPIYTLSASDVKQGAARLLLKRVEVKSKHLILTLGF